MVGKRLRHIHVAFVEGGGGDVIAEERERADGFAAQTEGDDEHAVDAHGLVDVGHVGADGASKTLHLEVSKQEELAAVDEVLAPGKLVDVASRRHERVHTGARFDIGDAGLQGQVVRDGSEPAAFRQHTHDAAVRDDARHRPGDDAYESLVVGRRFRERTQGPG